MKKVIVFSGGGTGGHIYPALAIAKKIEQLDPSVKIHFVGSARGLESKIIPKEGYPLHFISVGQFNKSAGTMKRIKTIFLLPWSLLQTFFLFLKLRPQSVLGLGGYVSVPFVLFSSLWTRTAVWEPNAFPGLANRLLSKFVQVCFVVFDRSKKGLKNKNVIRSGMPVRFELVNDEVSEINKQNFNVLVFGGSQGAKAINNVVSDMIESAGEELKGIRITHQTGARDYTQIKSKYKKSEFEKNGLVDVREYLFDMKAEYEKADLVICRSGASTVAELAASGKPSILIPYPWAADDHQKLNAEELGKKDAAIVLEEKDLNVESLKETLLQLKADSQQLKRMSDKVRDFHYPNAADDIAKWLV